MLRFRRSPPRRSVLAAALRSVAATVDPAERSCDSRLMGSILTEMGNGGGLAQQTLPVEYSSSFSTNQTAPERIAAFSARVKRASRPEFGRFPWTLTVKSGFL